MARAEGKRPKLETPGSASANAISIDSDEDMPAPPAAGAASGSVDLITPRESPVEDRPEADAAAAAPDPAAANHVAAPAPAAADAEEEEEGEMAEAPQPAKKKVPAASAAAADDDDDDDVAFLHRTGDLALVDFPHARENCAENPFVVGNYKKHCQNCYCYVCDAPASGCPKWSSHAPATHTSDSWKQQREAWARNGACNGGAGAGAGASSSSAASASSSSASGKAHWAASAGPSWAALAPAPFFGERWSCDDLLKATEAVYPIEEPEPAGLVAGTRLRPYQKQSIAFMKQAERATERETEGRNAVHGHSIRGGWLADEVGMGKTLVVTSLVLAERATVKPISDAAFKRLYEPRPDDFAASDPSSGPPKLHFKCTVVVVNNTLVQQWVDELRKFAPSLEVHAYYATREKKERALRRLRECDVLIATPHMFAPNHLPAELIQASASEFGLLLTSLIASLIASLSPPHCLPHRPQHRLLIPPSQLLTTHLLRADLLQNAVFHRLVVDEAHLLAAGSTAGCLKALMRVQAGRLWLVSGTPFSTSLRQLENQADLLGIRSSLSSINRPHVSNERVVEWLKKRVIRHTKNMRIGGEVALALPDADCRTKWLTMSEDERLLYGIHECDGREASPTPSPTPSPASPPIIHSRPLPLIHRCGDGHGLRLLDESRFRAASHLYNPDVVT